MIKDLDNQISEVLQRFVPIVSVRRRSFDSPWFDDECRIAFDKKKSAYRQWSGSRSSVVWDRFMHARCEAAALASAKASYSKQCVARF